MEMLGQKVGVAHRHRDRTVAEDRLEDRKVAGAL